MRSVVYARSSRQPELFADTTKMLAAGPSEEYVHPREINRVDCEDGAERQTDFEAVSDG